MRQKIKSLFGSDEIAGIDIGSHAVKIVFFQKEKDKLKLKTWGHIPLDIKPDIQPEEKKAIIASEIEKFFKKMGIKTRYVATSVSGNSVIVRYVKFPRLSKKELDLAINVEAEPFIPFDINDIYLSYYILNENIMEEGQPKMEVVLVAAKKDVVNEKIDILEQAGLSPVIVDVDSFSIENLYSRIPNKEDNKSVLFLNIGNKVSNLSILTAPQEKEEITNTSKKKNGNNFAGYTRVVRDIFISGASIDRIISKNMKIPAEQAKEFKKTIKLFVDDESKLEAIKNYDKQSIIASKSSMSVIKDLSGEVSRSIDFYLSQGIDHGISKIYLSGGVASLGNICAFLSGEFKVPVEIINPFSFLPEQPKNIPQDILPSLAVASGLALREMRDWK